MDLELTGRRVLLTGASKGIGLAAGELFAREGCEVILAARDAARLNDVADTLRATTRANVHAVSADLSDEQSRQGLIDRFGDVDILVNNAGSNPPGEIDDIDDTQWRKAWDLKVFGYINMTRAVYSAMKRRRSGVIINVIGSSGERMQSDYILGSSGNSALMGLTRALGSRSPDHNVRVLGINPGLTDTDRARFFLESLSRDRYGSSDQWEACAGDMDLPFGRMATAQEVADVIVFMASARASYVSGTIVTVDGGAANRHR